MNTLKENLANTLASFVTHYKTSLCGIAAGALIAVSHGTSWHTASLGAAIALLGLFAKDGDKGA